MKTRSLSERLEDKSAQALLTNHFRERYNYNPAMAEAIFQDTVFVRTLLDPTAREDGQIIRYFPKATEPAGKPLRDCEYGRREPEVALAHWSLLVPQTGLDHDEGAQ